MTAPSTTDTAPSTTPSIVSALATTLIEQGKAEAQQQIDKLLAQKQTTIHIKSSLKLLMERYNLEKGTLSEMVDWYGKQSWFDKTMLGMVFVATCALIGAIVNLTVVLTILSAALYYAANLMVSNEFDIKTRSNARLYQDIVEMEADLNKSATALNEAIARLNAIHATAFAQTTQSAEHINAANAQLATFAGQTTTYVETIKQLKQTTDSLKQNGEAASLQLQVVSESLATARLDATAHAGALQSVSQELNGTNTKLLERNAELLTLNQQFQANVTMLAALEAGFQAQLATLTARIAEDDALIATLRASANETLEHTVHPNNILDAIDAAMLDAELTMQANKDYCVSASNDCDTTTSTRTNSTSFADVDESRAYSTQWPQ